MSEKAFSEKPDITKMNTEPNVNQDKPHIPPVSENKTFKTEKPIKASERVEEEKKEPIFE